MLVNSPLKTCPTCGGDASRHIFSYINSLYEGHHSHFFEKLKIQYCSACGLGFAYPFISDVDLSDFYKEIYRSESKANAQQLNDIYFSGKYALRALSQLQLGRTFWYHAKPDPEILDIGAGNGSLLRIAKELFPRGYLSAIEPDRFSKNNLRSIGVKVFDFMATAATLSQINQQFDIIICSHLIEHLNANELKTFILSLKPLVSNNGIIIIEVPFANILKYPEQRHNDAPHLSFFSPQSLQKLLQQDFEVLFCNGCGAHFLDYFNNLSPHQEAKVPHHDSHPLKSFLKKTIRETNLPLVTQLIKWRRKLKSPEYYEIIKEDYYTYGPDRTFVRAVVKKN